jgi:hypothetical protein
MEPFAWTGIIVTGDHLAETDLITIAVSGLAIFIFVVALVDGFLVRWYRRYRLFGIALVGRRVCTPRWSGARLRRLSQGW